MPYIRAEIPTVVEVTPAPPPPPGKARVTFVVKMLGFIALPGVNITVNGTTVTTDKSGTAYVDLDVGRSYAYRAEAWFIEPVESTIEQLTESITVELKPLPRWWIIAGGVISIGALIYWLTHK